MDAENINMLWARMAIEELCRLGCETFCLAPGSRSTPLAVAIAEHIQPNKIVCYDERSLGFFALGHGRANLKPACVVVTSGTAVANLLPSVIEASVDQVPTIIITADRPGYLLDCGANQTIDQRKIFGHYPRWQHEISVVEDVSALQLLSTIDYAYHRSLQPNPGPVHLNWHFDEPLAPTVREFANSAWEGVEKWEQQQKPFTDYVSYKKTISQEAVVELAKQLRHTERGVLIVGAPKSSEDKIAVKKLAERLNWPVITDISGGLGDLSGKPSPCITERGQGEGPQVVLQFGSRLIEKSVPKFIRMAAPTAHILIDPSDQRLDPEHSVTQRITCDINSLVADLLPLLPENKIPSCNRIANTELVAAIDEQSALSQQFVALKISELAGEHHALFIGNSMPIRAMNLFSPRLKSSLIATNRGASGIDGNISTACGFAQALGKRLVAFMGDLTFLHDINGLSLLKYCPEPVIFIVANNNGGGIFSFLPIAEHKEFFSPYFDSPQEFELGSLCRGFGIDHVKTFSKQEFIAALTASLSTENHLVIEAMTSTQADLAIERKRKNDAR